MKHLTQVRDIQGAWWWLDQDHCAVSPYIMPGDDPIEDGRRIVERETFKVWEYGNLPKKWYQRQRKGWFVVGDIRTMPEYN